MSKKLHKSGLSKVLIGLIVLLVIGACIGGYFWYHAEHSTRKIVTAGTVVPLPKSDQPSSTPPLNKTPSSNNNGTSNAGGATDNQGANVPSTNSSDWTTSASGLITVKSPTANQVLKSGDTIGGSAQVTEVGYRLSDNKVGVIAQGTLQVVGGNFSGVIHFTSQGTGGRLDIFSTNGQGVEFNEVQINVSF